MIILIHARMEHGTTQRDQRRPAKWKRFEKTLRASAMTSVSTWRPSVIELALLVASCNHHNKLASVPHRHTVSKSQALANERERSNTRQPVESQFTDV